ncbi:DUF3489 domain-containing protein [Muricoccus aerilatus]|uniref:DUF3489 domain-containing protein n=1 Tax=Muricoccus aerilatus TaxID=452982 RepID=UPI000694F9F2|nr:DUF3489 domain-containing protein [Roseomonas aerilata]
MTKPLSPTQAQILSAAVQHPTGLAEAPALPAAARHAVFGSLLRAGLLEEVPSLEGSPTTLRISAAGLAAVRGTDADEVTRGDAVGAQKGGEGERAMLGAPGAQEMPMGLFATPRSSNALRAAATALLVAWDAGEGQTSLSGAVEGLHAALSRAVTPRSACDPSAPRRPREGTKQQAVLTLLYRTEGTTIAQVMEATGWTQHTVRGFLAGLKK